MENCAALFTYHLVNGDFVQLSELNVVVDGDAFSNKPGEDDAWSRESLALIANACRDRTVDFKHVLSRRFRLT